MLVNEFFNTNPENLKFVKDLVDDAYSIEDLDNTFALFNSLKNIIYLIYTNKIRSLVIYDMIQDKITLEIKNAHKNQEIINIRHFLDKANNRDLILSISNNNVKIWDIDNFECILNLENKKNFGKYYLSCFLSNNKESYIITNNFISLQTSSFKTFDFKGNFIKKMNCDVNKIYFLDSFYDEENGKNYIITGNSDYAISYDFSENKEYHKYFNIKFANQDCRSIVLYRTEGILKLIRANDNGAITFWNFHSGEILSNSPYIYSRIYGLCLWNKDYLFAGNSKEKIFLLKVKNNEIDMCKSQEKVLTIKKINHPKLGNILISQSLKGNIKLWSL